MIIMLIVIIYDIISYDIYGILTLDSYCMFWVFWTAAIIVALVGLVVCTYALIISMKRASEKPISVILPSFGIIAASIMLAWSGWTIVSAILH